MEETGSGDVMKLPEDMYDESMGDTEEEDAVEIVVDIRQARHILEEVNWEPDKMEDWQWDLMYRYVPSPDRSENESDRSYTTERVKETVQTLYEKTERSESVDEDNPIVEYVEGEDMSKKYPDVFTTYAFLKMNVFKTRTQPHPPMTFGRCTYEDDDEGDDDADELSDDDEDDEPGPKKASDEDEEKKPKDKKPAKERRKLKKKKRRDEMRRLRDEVIKQKIAIETIEGPASEQPSDPNYLTKEHVFLNEEDMQKIDELCSANHLKYYSPHKRERTTTLPENISPGKDEPPISIAPSFKDLATANLEKQNRTYYLHRVVYMFAYRTTDLIDESNIEAPILLKGYVAEQNTSYSVEYFVSGCLFFFEGFAVVMVEGGENELMRHFLEMRGSAMLGEFLHGRILYVHGHVVKRYFQQFVTCTADCTGPVEKVEKTQANDIIQSFCKKMTNLYKKLPKMGEIFKPGCVIKLPENLAKTLPSIKQIKFLLKLKVLRKLPAFVNQFIEIPYISDSSDEAWPPQDYEIPYNILVKSKREQLDLEHEMWAKVRGMKTKFNELEKKRKRQEMNNKKFIKELIKRRKASEAIKTKQKVKKVDFLHKKKKAAFPKQAKPSEAPKENSENENKVANGATSDKTVKSILKTDLSKPEKNKLQNKNKNLKKTLERVKKKVKMITKATVSSFQVSKPSEDSEWITDDATVEE